jgi:cell fate regulator YaaT (PSP1 superfamily)
MNDILRDFLHKFVTVYLDDVCIYNRTMEEHLEHRRLVLQRFKEEGLKLRLKKCFFGLQEMGYLGYTVSDDKISVSTKKVDAEGSSQFRRVLQLIRQMYSSFQRPYGSIVGLLAEVPCTEGSADACLFGSF